MKQRPKSRNSLPTDRHHVTLFSPALNANFQGNAVPAFGSPSKIIADFNFSPKAPVIFHRRREGSKFASTLSLCRRSTSPQASEIYVPTQLDVESCEKMLLKKLGGFGSAKHDRIIAHSARFDMFDDDEVKETDGVPSKSQDVKRGLTSAQVAVLKEMSLRSHSNSVLGALEDKDSSVYSDAMDLWLEEIIAERNKFASAHLFAKAKIRESIDIPHSQTPTANETVIMCCCLADMIASLSLTTDIKAELGQMWGRLMRSVFQSWEDSATELLVSQAHEPFLRSEVLKKILNVCYQRHAFHDISDKVWHQKRWSLQN